MVEEAYCNEWQDAQEDETQPKKHIPVYNLE